MTAPLKALDPPEVEELEALAGRLQAIEGWFAPREAWELHESARRIPAGRAGLAVEIGSWKGRSTAALALGLRARGSGRVVAIDPQVGADRRYAELLTNLDAAGVRDVVEVIRDFSTVARPRIADDSVDLLFIDGDHAYASVREDLETWESSVVPGAVVAFNDPGWPGVNRLLRERLTSGPSPFRRPRLVVNTLFVDYRPDAPWTAEDEALRASCERMLRYLRTFTRRLGWSRRLLPGGVVRRYAARGSAALRRLHPLVDMLHYGWISPPREG